MANTLKFGNGQWAVKEGSTLAYNDENNNFKPLPFNFERDSRATVVNKDGLIETVGHNTPRIDYKDDSKGSLLLEPSRTNLITYSEDFSQGWSSNGGGVTINQTISPDGTLNADKLFAQTNNGQHRVDFYSSNASGATTFSFFAKSAEYNSLWARIGLSTVYFNLEDGDSYNNTTDTTSSMNYYGNGWYRCIITKEISSANEVCRINLTQSYKNGSIWTGDGTSGIYVWGAMHEVGSYATSYIPTQGSIGTRYADICNGAGNDQVFNDSEGVLFAEISALSDDLSERRISLNDGSTSNLIRLGYNNNSNTVLIAVYDGSNQVVLSHTLADITDSNKFAFKYKQNDYALWVNGIEVGTNTSSFVFPNGTLTNLSFNRGDNNVNFRFHGNTKQIQYFDTALSDAELKALTS